MPKTSILDLDETAGNNTDLDGVNINENCPAPNLNNGLRSLASMLASFTGADTIASATTTDLSTVEGQYVTVTGTTTITGLGTAKAGWIKVLKFSGALTLTHNATSLILRTGANRTTVAGDVMGVVSEGSGNWRELFYHTAAEDTYNADMALLALEVADLKGARLNMTGGIADPFDTQTGVDATDSTNETYDGTNDWYSPAPLFVGAAATSGSSAIQADFTLVDRSFAVTNSVTATHFAIFSNTAGSGKIKFVNEDSSTQFDVLRDQAFTHGGTGMEFFAISGGYSVPGSGTVRVAIVWTSGGPIVGTVGSIHPSVSRAFKSGDVTGDNQSGFTADTGGISAIGYAVGVENMTLISEGFTAAAQPSTARLAVQVVENESITVNTDLTGEVSRDDGSTWTAGTLALTSTNGSAKIYEDTDITISAQPSGTTMRYRVKTLNNKDIDVTGVVMQWL